MAYGIGLDIGIASVGWAVVDLDYDENSMGIIRMGSRIFDAAENPKDGASLALPRREARSARRRLRRHRHRLERIKNLFVQEKLISEKGLNNLFSGKLKDIYQLRTEALDTLLTDEEMVRVLLHIAQRRGFKSNKKDINSIDKNSVADKEEGELLGAVQSNRDRMAEHGYRTVGEMFYKDPLFAEHKRNKGGEYLATVGRADIEDEIKKIFASQYALGNKKFNETLMNKYLDIVLSQRNFDEGPGGDSPYGGNQIERMIGKCTFEDGEPRAAKACYSFEYFDMLQKVNHMRLSGEGQDLELDDEQRGKIFTLALAKENLTYATIRKELGLCDKLLFNNLNYPFNEDTEAFEKKQKLKFMSFYHKVRKALDKGVAKGRIAAYSPEQLDEIGRIVSIYKSIDKRKEALITAGIPALDVECLLDLSGAKFGHLSLKALRKIIPFMEKGSIYNEACTEAGYNFRGHNDEEKQMFLPAQTEDMEAITSPVARRAISQTIKVINAIIREQGESPLYINVELAREMSRDFAERKKIEKSYETNRENNEKLIEELKTTYGISEPTGQDLIKLKLFREQDGISPYLQQKIELEKLFEVGYVDVDHIVPYSISFDDSFNNKVLVLSSENREKGNCLPLQYLQQQYGQDAADAFTVWVNNNVQNYRKKVKLLKKNITEQDKKEFKERNLTDTKTISRFMYNYINDYLAFAPSERKKRVTAVNGAVTAYLRKRWGIKKVRENGDKHHAVDALVIACATDGLIQRVSRYSDVLETKDNLTKLDKKFPLPYEDFRVELEARTSDDPQRALEVMQLDYYLDKDLGQYQPIFVSRMPKHKVTGQAHEDTIKSEKILDDGHTVVVVKTALTKLNLKDGKIEGYYNPSSDLLLYNALKQQLQKFDGNADKAFAEPFYKPKSDGTPGHRVDKVKIYKKSTLNVPVHNGNGVADNGGMVRVDVFFVKNEGYYLVPIYVADTKKAELPNKAIVANKPYEEWKEMWNEDFVFSLYPNDLFGFEHKKGVELVKSNKESTMDEKIVMKQGLLYYIKTGISTGSITALNNDHTYEIPSLGVKTLVKLEKYQVDVLGNISKVGKEIRQKFR